jgi:hypothetical protein
MQVAESGLYSAKVHEGYIFQAQRLLYVLPVLTFHKPINVSKSVSLRRVRVTIVFVEKEYLLAILSLSVTLHIHYAMRMRRIMSSVACLNLPYFSKLSHKRNDFQEKLQNKKYVV